MNKDVILSLVRTLLTGISAFLIGKNILGTAIDQSLWQEIVGAIVGMGSIIWGIVDKSATIEAIQSALRSLFVVGGGLLVASGKITGDMLTGILGLLAPLIAFIYSITSKAKTTQIVLGKVTPTTDATGKTVLKKAS